MAEESEKEMDKGPLPRPQPETDFGGTPPNPPPPPPPVPAAAEGWTPKFFRRRGDQESLVNRANEVLLDARHRRHYRTSAMWVGFGTIAVFLVLLVKLVFAIEEHVADYISPLAVAITASLILSLTVMVLGFAKYAFAPMDEMTAGDSKNPDVPTLEAAKLAFETGSKFLSEAGKIVGGKGG